jgi:hypothetical protein
MSPSSPLLRREIRKLLCSSGGKGSLNGISSPVSPTARTRTTGLHPNRKRRRFQPAKKKGNLGMY